MTGEETLRPKVLRGKRGPYDAHTINQKIQHLLAFEELRRQSPTSTERALFEYYTSASGVSRSTLQKWLHQKDKMVCRIVTFFDKSSY